MQCGGFDGATAALEWMKIKQDTKMWSVPGRNLRVGVTSMIQHARLLDAKEQNKTKVNRTEQYCIM